MDKIKKELFRRIRDERPKAKEESIKSKINDVLKIDIDLVKSCTDVNNRHYLQPFGKQWELLISMLYDEVELIFTRIDEKYNRQYGVTNIKSGEQEYLKKSFGKATKVPLEEIEGNPYSIQDSEEDLQNAVHELLINPLVLERYDLFKALEVIQKYYPLPYFEKEAYILRLKRKIKQANIGYEESFEDSYTIESFLSEKGILSFQRRAAIRLKLLWRKEIIRRLKAPYSDIIQQGLDIK